MSTLAEVREKVRLQTDNDSTDLPDGILDGFIREGFDRTFAAERLWPFFEYTWTIALVDGDTTIEMPTSPEVAFITRLVDTDDSVILGQIPQSSAEDSFVGGATSSSPQFFSVWGTTMSLWPQPTAGARNYRMRGYRKPLWTTNPTSEMDGDARLHLAIFHYATSLVYAQLEDGELEQMYLQRWAAHTEAVRRDIMRPDFHEPLILNGGIGAERHRQVALG